MPFFELFKGYPFPGSFAKFALPPGPDDWQPKSWGDTGYAVQFSELLRDDNGTFITDGLQVGDVVYITYAEPALTLANIVQTLVSDTIVRLFYTFNFEYTNIVYKMGMKAPHTLQSLATIISARALYAYTIHWSLVWTQAPFLDFAHDETGDVYVCHNPGEKRLKKMLKEKFTDENGNDIPNPWPSLNPEPEL